MEVFISSPHHRGLHLFDEDGEIAKFKPVGETGSFTTGNKTVIEKLEKHPEYGKAFFKAKDRMQKFDKNPDGAPVNPLQKEAEQKNNQVTKKVRRLGYLEGILFKGDGSYRKDAEPEMIEEYEKLLNEIGK